MMDKFLAVFRVNLMQNFHLSRYSPGSQEFMNNQYLQHPLRKTIIETSWEYFSISICDRKHQASFLKQCLNFGFAQIVKFCATHGHDFSKTTYQASRNSSRYSTKISIWTYNNLEPPTTI